MTTLDLDTETTPSLDIDLTADVPCAADDCPRPATWHETATHTTGAHCTHATVCDPHQRINHTRYTRWPRVICAAHHTTITLHWTPL